MAFDITAKEIVRSNSFDKPTEKVEFYCESLADIPNLPRYPEIKVGSKAIIVEDMEPGVIKPLKQGKPLKFCICMRTGWVGPY